MPDPTEQENGAPDPVDWALASRVARQAVRLSPSSVSSARLAGLVDDFAEATARAERLVEEATGLTSTAGPARALVTDRAGWVEANIGSFRRLLRPVGARLAASPKAKRALHPISKGAAGVEVGLLLAWMSGRVLGQYDLLPGDASAGDAVYYVGPNIVELESRHGFPPKEFRLWIALHELTHRLQFTGVPWMRPYFLGLIERGADLSAPDAQAVLESLRRAVSEVRAGRSPFAEGGVVGLIASSDQLATLHEAQALMSLLEGHGDVVMSKAAQAELPEAERFAKVLHERRSSASGVTRAIQQVIGLEAKLRQYAEGEHFVEAVLESGGEELFARVWESSAMLPSLEEVRSPDLWIDRVGGRAAASA